MQIRKCYFDIVELWREGGIEVDAVGVAGDAVVVERGEVAVRQWHAVVVRRPQEESRGRVAVVVELPLGLVFRMVEFHFGYIIYKLQSNNCLIKMQFPKLRMYPNTNCKTFPVSNLSLNTVF